MIADVRAVARRASAAFALVLTASAAHAEDPAADGRALYLEFCASCHGANLEGQPDWRAQGPNGRLPAPPHDETGHTWHHPDRVLKEITRRGPAAIVGPGYESDMPGFEGVLSDREIDAVIDYIKGTWPDRERQFQADRTKGDEAARE